MDPHPTLSTKGQCHSPLVSSNDLGHHHSNLFAPCGIHPHGYARHPDHVEGGQGGKEETGRGRDECCEFGRKEGQDKGKLINDDLVNKWENVTHLMVSSMATI